LFHLRINYILRPPRMKRAWNYTSHQVNSARFNGRSTCWLYSYAVGLNYNEVELISVLGSKSGINIGPYDADPADLTVAGDFLFFAATTLQHGREVWFINATDSSIRWYPTMLDIQKGLGLSSNPASFCSSGGHLPIYFRWWADTRYVGPYVSAFLCFQFDVVQQRLDSVESCG
jgi:hypothetical protein